MTVTVIFSSQYKKITLIVTVHYDSYCDFLRYEIQDSEKTRHFETTLFFSPSCYNYLKNIYLIGISLWRIRIFPKY